MNKKCVREGEREFSHKKKSLVAYVNVVYGVGMGAVCHWAVLKHQESPDNKNKNRGKMEEELEILKSIYYDDIKNINIAQYVIYFMIFLL